MNIKWKPILEAPLETVVVTDRGFAICTQLSWLDKIPDWYLCDTSGNVASCANYGCYIARIYPTKWIFLEDIGLTP
jgi:hypothetical protein